MTLKERLAQPGMKEAIAKATRKLERSPAKCRLYYDDERAIVPIKYLLALESVARAAQRVSDDTAGDDLAVEHLCALDRALSRLSRVRGGR